MEEVKFEIVDHIFSLPSSSTFHKELNKISWNNRDPVYDLRGWNEDRTKMTKGITLSEKELEAFISKIKEVF
ncbi:hypothetical protein DFR55_10955 [Herbinix hemicellulosilytica]|uniref:Transcriptional coactivator p15 (PC4) C-terminal domain-containing protein n=1 Tax=Herbinix hemicellulosilytica TaxID=1564487 RepID=A0A0H5SX77_HERHM|nr:PC4/YdbC family ssDNA-binding protein [Herbinix hemicellulosilytica]RBP58840.1 hypothetical protein DFR55_10955 [Herbinix hemicellulosilytica]CRZ34953.1 hypothetical protein HHT355_1753 [Herbinix hemicellulosilytica]